MDRNQKQIDEQSRCSEFNNLSDAILKIRANMAKIILYCKNEKLQLPQEYYDFEDLLRAQVTRRKEILKDVKYSKLDLEELIEAKRNEITALIKQQTDASADGRKSKYIVQVDKDGNFTLVDRADIKMSPGIRIFSVICDNDTGAWFAVPRKLGSGGNGRVKQLVHISGKKPDKDVVLKAIDFYDELNGNIAREFNLKQINISDKKTHIIMPFCKGKDLFTLLRDEENPIPMADKITIMKNLCLAMQEMHSAGLIHCDFKSLNVMCDASDNYKITIIDVDGGKVGAYIGELLTTDGYRSPFVDGPSDYRDPDYYENIYNKKSDIFALGVTCLEVYYNYVMENKYGALENMEKSYDPMVRELSEIISDMLKYGEGKITTLDLAVVGSKFDKLHEKVEKPSIAVDVAKELNAEGRKKINYTSSSKELLQTIAKFRKARNYSKEENLSFESQVKSLRKTLSIGNKIYFSLCNNIKSVRNSKIAKFNPGNTY